MQLRIFPFQGLIRLSETRAMLSYEDEIMMMAMMPMGLVAGESIS
jgi:hypothetical protein